MKLRLSKLSLFCHSLLLLGATSVLAQPKVQFDKVEHDMGTIAENDAVLSVTFKLKNTGTEDLVIKDVSTSCGCIFSSLANKVVLPDSSTIVNVSVNPYNRPGFFNKTITITSNAVPEVYTLTVKGIVIPNPRDPMVEFPVKRGNLRFVTNGFNIGTVTTDKPVERTLEVYNDSQKEIKLLKKVNIPEHIKLVSKELVIKPKQVSKIVISYDAKMKNDFGFVSDYLEIYTNSREDSLIPLSVFGSIEEKVSIPTESQLAKAPKITVERPELYLGRYRKGSEVVGSFVIKSTGRSPLIIKKIKPSCSCVNATIPLEKIPPLQSAFLSFNIKSHELLGSNIKTITLFTNDPLNPVVVLNVKFDIFQ